MKAREFIQTSLSLLFLLAAFSCCDEGIEPKVEEKPVEPVRTTAQFSIRENVSDSLFVADTVLNYNTIVFTAADNRKYKSYKWKVGNDERTFDRKSFSLRFMEPIGKVDVTLVVTYEPDLENFPDDPGTDTITKSFYVMDWRNSLTIGKYVGYNESNPNDIFEVEISRELDVDGFPVYDIRNINKGCNPSPHTWSGGIGAKVQLFENRRWYGEGCKGVEAWAVVTSPDSIEINYSYGDDTKPFGERGYPRVKERFIGKRK